MYPYEHDVRRNRMKNFKHFLEEYWIFHWIFLLGSLTFVFISSTNYTENLAPHQQYLILALSWGIIGALEYAAFILGGIVFQNEIRKDLVGQGTSRKAYSLTFILSPIFGAIVGLIMYSTILLVLQMYLREVDILLVIFISSIAGFNYLWIINGYVVEKVFLRLNRWSKTIRWHMQVTDLRTIIEEGTQKFFPLTPDTGKEETTIISKSQIITIDASVIVALLIFIFTKAFEIAQQGQITIFAGTIVFIVFPFVISAVATLRNHDKFAIRLMIAGFINSMIPIILIAVMGLE
jgi:hypothetical protein